MASTSAIHWAVNPILISIGPIELRWYGLLFSLGFLICFLVMEKIMAWEGRPVEDAGSVLTTMVISVLTGARLGHCLFYEPGYYLQHPLKILAIWEGGLASHGAVVGMAIGLWIYSRKKPDQPFLWIADRVAIVAAAAGFCIRLGNLFNSEIIGKETNLPWAFVFERVDQVPRHPTQLYESLWYLICFFILFYCYRHWKVGKRMGWLLGANFILIFVFRFFVEFIKEPQVDFEAKSGIYMGQMLSIPVVLLGAFLIWRSYRIAPAPEALALSNGSASSGKPKKKKKKKS